MQMFLTDRGRHWTRKAYPLGNGQPGKPGTLPFNATYGYGKANGGLWRRGNRLFSIAATDTGPRQVKNPGIGCSIDDGTTWSQLCLR